MAGKNSGQWGWLGLGTYVLAYDVWALKTGRETLSGACWRGCEHKKLRYIVEAGILITAKHLAAPHVLPQVDPFAWLADWLKKVDEQ